MANKIKVLVIDDSAMVRQILEKGLAMDGGIEVVGTASDPYVARDKIIELNPDVLTLDVEMPRMDGVEFLRKLMPQHPIPVVMVSSLTQKGRAITLDALEAGAVDFISKPTSNVVDGLNSMIMELRTKIKIASTANVSHWKNKRFDAAGANVNRKKPSTVALDETTHKIIAIGASTGGTEALKSVIDELPSTSPGVVIVQHMPEVFTKMYADRLNQSAAMQVVEAKDGETVVPGKVLIAPGGLHMELVRTGGIYKVRCFTADRVNGHCPSVEVLFKSVAKCAGKNSIGIILTGMGNDGALGMLDMKNSGSMLNIAQDEKTCVVFGMPKEAIAANAVHEVLPLDKIAGRVISFLRGFNG